MKMNPVKIGLILTLLMSVTVACGKKDKKDSQVTAARVARDGGSGSANLPQQSFAGSSAGFIEAQSQYAVQFERAIKDFASATVAPEAIGTINTSRAVVLRGNIRVGAGGVVDPNSKIMIEINDSFVGRDEDGQILESIKIVLPLDSTQRSVVQNGQATLIFRDQYGSVTLQGSWDNQWFSGTASFVNSTIYQGAPAGTTPKQGTMGYFYVQTCGFFVCQ